MKHAPPESIKQRVIPPEVINEVTLELHELEGEVMAVQREEKEEKEVRLNRWAIRFRSCTKFWLVVAQFRKGNMEVTKGQNMIQHEREIMSRPARTWFQTEAEKKTAKSAFRGLHPEVRALLLTLLAHQALVLLSTTASLPKRSSRRSDRRARPTLSPRCAAAIPI
mgnify:FL=1